MVKADDPTLPNICPLSDLPCWYKILFPKPFPFYTFQNMTLTATKSIFILWLGLWLAILSKWMSVNVPRHSTSAFLEIFFFFLKCYISRDVSDFNCLYIHFLNCLWIVLISWERVIFRCFLHCFVFGFSLRLAATQP